MTWLKSKNKKEKRRSGNRRSMVLSSQASKSVPSGPDSLKTISFVTWLTEHNLFVFRPAIINATTPKGKGPDLVIKTRCVGSIYPRRDERYSGRGGGRFAVRIPRSPYRYNYTDASLVLASLLCTILGTCTHAHYLRYVHVHTLSS